MAYRHKSYADTLFRQGISICYWPYNLYADGLVGTPWEYYAERFITPRSVARTAWGEQAWTRDPGWTAKKIVQSTDLRDSHGAFCFFLVRLWNRHPNKGELFLISSSTRKPTFSPPRCPSLLFRSLTIMKGIHFHAP